MYLPRTPRTHYAASPGPSSSSPRSRPPSNLFSSSQVSQLSRSTQHTVSASHNLYQTPPRIVEPPPLASHPVDKHSRRPRVRFSSLTTDASRNRSHDSIEEESSFEGEDAELGSESNHGVSSRVVEDDEMEILFPQPGTTQSASRQFRLSSRANYLNLLKPTLAELETGPLATVPIVDLEAFSRIYAITTIRAVDTVALCGECSAAFEEALVDYEEQTEKTRAVLMVAQAQTHRTRHVERYRKIDSLIKKLAVVNSNLLENRLSTSREIVNLKSSISTQLSFLAQQWQAAAVQYRAAFVKASTISSPSQNSGRASSAVSSKSATSSRANGAISPRAKGTSTKDRGNRVGRRK
ncbi:hypothetical protein JCM5350_001893 [Sporobolomyces pararoseus]